jgi:hypothetical protein
MSGRQQDNTCGKSRGKQQRQTTPLAMPKNAVLVSQRFTLGFMPKNDYTKLGSVDSSDVLMVSRPIKYKIAVE